MGLEPISVHFGWGTYQVCFNSAFPFYVLSEHVESKRIPIIRSLVLRLFWCIERDSNSQSFRHWLLRPACMPFHHRRIIYIF